MRTIVALGLVFAVGCGGAEAAQPADWRGAWDVSVPSLSCVGVLSISGDDSAVTGMWGVCRTMGYVSGIAKDGALALTVIRDEFHPMTITATIDASGGKMSGTINGSGATNLAFTATRAH